MKKDSFDVLVGKGLIRPGSFLPVDVIAEALGDQAGCPFALMSLRERIQLNGFFVTSNRCPEGSLRILKTEEMADCAIGRLEKNKHNNEKIALIMQAHDISSLSDKAQKKHRDAQSRASKCAAYMSEALLSADIL